MRGLWDGPRGRSRPTGRLAHQPEMLAEGWPGGQPRPRGAAPQNKTRTDGELGMKHRKLWMAWLIGTFLILPLSTDAQERLPDPIAPSPDRRTGEGEGPFDRLVIRGITMIDGTGAPPRGPVDIAIEGNRIKEVKSVAAPGVPIE